MEARDNAQDFQWVVRECHGWKRSWFRWMYAEDNCSYQGDRGLGPKPPALLDLLLSPISGVEKKTCIYHKPAF